MEQQDDLQQQIQQLQQLQQLKQLQLQLEQMESQLKQNREQQQQEKKPEQSEQPPEQSSEKPPEKPPEQSSEQQTTSSGEADSESQSEPPASQSVPHEKFLYALPKVVSVRDAAFLQDILRSNLHAVKQFRQAAQNCQLPDIKSQIEEAGKMHLKHVDSLIAFIDEAGGKG
ncbi:hypothetical protein MHZ95_11370 [Sporosarcina sp. ACRSM]|uniref:hypothetical protein n=1 Tax=Sporosarcina sp. ACRSM TaxID=2918216 RepID=UPI001EF5D00C|nr:hypothetical protein [Sporosarcina sp. ACRSM]MCG7335880.1 hypothetical protein [Sporosarcina sp. ACRSM]